MLRDIDVAKYFISKDVKHDIFTFSLVEKNGRKFYEGNARLNKYLQIAQNIYIAKHGRPLFKTIFLAYDNGAVAKDVADNYSRLVKMQESIEIDKDIRSFLDKIFIVFNEAPLDDLIEISHEDPAWIEKSGNYYNSLEIMDSMKFKDVYKKQYSDILYYMEGLDIDD